MVLPDIKSHNSVNKDEHFSQKRWKTLQFMCQFRHFLFKPIWTVFRPCRDCESHDTCDQPGHVDVLGDIPLVGNGNYGGLDHVTEQKYIIIIESVCFIGLFFFV